MPEDSRKPQGLTRNEIIVLCVIIAGLAAYIGFMLFTAGAGREEPTGPTREVIVDEGGPAPSAGAPLSPSVKRSSEDWLWRKQEEVASEPGVPRLQPEIQVYHDENVRIPFRIMVERQSEDLLEEVDRNAPLELTE